MKTKSGSSIKCFKPLFLPCALVFLIHEIQCPTSLMQGFHLDATQESVKRNDFCFSTPLRETAVSFLQHHSTGTNVWLPKIHRTAPDIDFESARWQYCLYPRNQTGQYLTTSLVPVLLPNSALTTEISHLSICAPIKGISEKSASIRLVILPGSVLWKLIVIKIRCGDFVSLLDRFVRKFAVFGAFLCASFHVVGPRTCVAEGSLPAQQWFYRAC